MQLCTIRDWLASSAIEEIPELDVAAGMLPVNGLILRGESLNISKERVYPSIKVKLGGQTAKGDALSLFQMQQSGGGYFSKETSQIV
eukprot:11247896-Ditylum_brightwellii.AAC.1